MFLFATLNSNGGSSIRIVELPPCPVSSRVIFCVELPPYHKCALGDIESEARRRGIATALSRNTLRLECNDSLRVRWLSNQIFVGLSPKELWNEAGRAGGVLAAFETLLPVGYEWKLRFNQATGVEQYSTTGWYRCNVIGRLRCTASQEGNLNLLAELDSRDWEPVFIHMLTGQIAMKRWCLSLTVALSVMVMSVVVTTISLYL